MIEDIPANYAQGKIPRLSVLFVMCKKTLGVSGWETKRPRFVLIEDEILGEWKKHWAFPDEDETRSFLLPAASVCLVKGSADHHSSL